MDMENNILRIIAPVLLAFKYALLGWALWFVFGSSPDGLELLATIMKYWYWLFVVTLTFILTAIMSGIIPPKTPEENERTSKILYDLFKDIPILKYIEGKKEVSRIISFTTIGIVIMSLYKYQMVEPMNALAIPFIISTILLIILKLKET